MYDLLKQLCRERGITISKLCTEVTGNSANLAPWKKDNIPFRKEKHLPIVTGAFS